MARREFMSEKAKDRVEELTYQISGYFTITRSTDYGSYFTRKIKNKNNAEQKIMAEDLYPLPPYLLPYDPIDGAGILYLNNSHLTITQG